MINLSTQEIAMAVGGCCVATGKTATGISTDSRSLRPGDLFFALRVPDSTVDGHDFLDRAADSGASAVIVSRPVDLPDGVGVVQVDDTLLALGRLAAQWRRRMPTRIVAVTGSVGKTSTKGMLAPILEAEGATLSAPRSYNNEIGVPLTLLQLTRAHRFCALELAMRGPGEIDYLAKIARPEVGVITNIGSSHVGRLGSREAIAHAKGELLPHLPPTGRAILQCSDRFFGILAELSGAPVLSFGDELEAEVRAEEIDDRGLDGTSFTCVLPTGRVRIVLSEPGAHQVQNALAAAAAAHALGIAPERIAAGLEAYAGAEMRGRVVRTLAGATIIDDSYNAAPVSVGAALRLLHTTSGRKVFVFGGMAELGDESDDNHRIVGAQVAAFGVAHLIVVGELPAITADAAEQAGVATTRLASTDDALELLRRELRPGDAVLVKGSRVAHLERVVEGLVSDV